MRFRKDNRIKYGQDHGQYVGIPPGIDFRVERIGNRFKLIAPGYGDLSTPGAYGNGALYVWGLTQRQTARFEAGILEI